MVLKGPGTSRSLNSLFDTKSSTMSDPSWPMDHVLHLIELYEDNSVLWNHTMEEHKDFSAYEQAKQKIVEGLKKKGGTTQSNT